MALMKSKISGKRILPKKEGTQVFAKGSENLYLKKEKPFNKTKI